MTARVAVLASGGGSNLQAILDYFDAQGTRRGADVALVASDRAAAGALTRARQHGVPALALDKTQRDSGLEGLLQAHDVDYIALAGYLRFVPVAVTRRWRGRIVNVHPSLLPSFGGAGMYGIRVHEAAIEAGVRVTGVTVHFVDEEYDRGPIIAQYPVPVMPNDTAATLADRVLTAEHTLYPPVIEAVALGRVTLGADGRVAGLDALTRIVLPWSGSSPPGERHQPITSHR
jgi:formyltetrahydrofolate-dependent phosphoribosylglycinamide formyltransferase